MRHDRTGELVEEDTTAPGHDCDRGWVEASEGRVRRCASCAPTPKLTEKAWQARVIDLAKFRGWRHFHAFDSRRSVAGWPDLVLLRDGRLIFAELKTDNGRLTTEQNHWLEALRAVPFAEVDVWRPADWNRVMETLA